MDLIKRWYDRWFRLLTMLLLGALVLWEFSQPQTKKVLLSVHGVPGAVPYTESDPGYFVTFIKGLDEGLR